MKSYLDITQKYLKNQKKRSILTCIGIILSVALICAVGTMLMSFKQIEINSVKENTGDWHVKFNDVNLSQINKIKAHVDTKKIACVYSVGDSKFYDENETDVKKYGIPKYKYFSIQAYDKNSFEMLPKIKLEKGRIPKNSNEIVIEDWTLKYLPKGTKIGNNIKLNLGKIVFENKGNEAQMDYQSGKYKEYKLVGIIKSNQYYSGNSVARAFTSLDNLNNKSKFNVYVDLNKNKDTNEYIKEVNKSFNLPKGETIKNDKNQGLLDLEGKFNSNSTQTQKSIMYMAIFVIGIIIVCTILVIYNIFQISILERIKQFGILRSIGASPKQIKRIVFKEAFILSLISIPIGLFLGVFAMKIVAFIVTKILGSMLLVKFKIIVSKKVLLISSIIALITVFVSAIKPALTASKVSPLSAIRNNSMFEKIKIKNIKNNFLVNKIFKIEGEIAYKNIKINKKRFNVTICSMVISIVLFVVFGNLLSVGENLSKRNDYSYMDYSLSIQGHGNQFSENDYSKVKAINGIDKVYKMRINYGYNINVSKNKMNKDYLANFDKSNNIHKRGKNYNVEISEFMGFDKSELDVCKKHLKSGQINEDLMNKENGVLIVQETMDYDKKAKKNKIVNITNYKVGDEIEVNRQTLDGQKTYKMKVVGILKENCFGKKTPDYSKVFVMTTDKVFDKLEENKVFDKLEEKNSFQGMQIILKKDANRKSIKNQLVKLTEADKRIYLNDVKEEIESVKKANLVLKIFLYGFICIVTLISSLNIINTINTNLMLRKGEIASLQAIGMSNRQVKKMVYLEGILYGIISAFIGSILGTALSYLMYKIICKRVAFSWQIPWKFIGISIVCSIIISFMSTYFPFKNLKNQNLSDFNNL